MHPSSRLSYGQAVLVVVAVFVTVNVDTDTEADGGLDTVAVVVVAFNITVLVVPWDAITIAEPVAMRTVTGSTPPKNPQSSVRISMFVYAEVLTLSGAGLRDRSR